MPRVLPVLLLFLAACAASAPPERVADLRAKAKACSDALPTLGSYGVDRFGSVQASAQGPDAGLVERNFMDCVHRRGRWTTWAPGQPAPMLEPLGDDPPDPSSRVP
jgi:hypothetical protein